MCRQHFSTLLPLSWEEHLWYLWYNVQPNSWNIWCLSSNMVIQLDSVPSCCSWVGFIFLGRFSKLQPMSLDVTKTVFLPVCLIYLYTIIWTLHMIVGHACLCLQMNNANADGVILVTPTHWLRSLNLFIVIVFKNCKTHYHSSVGLGLLGFGSLSVSFCLLWYTVKVSWQSVY